MKAKFSPSMLRGRVTAPPSKSMAHRLLICAGLCAGESEIKNIAPSQDILATLDCLGALGARYTYDGYTVKMHGTDISALPAGAVLPCRECGSTIRFFVPICLLAGSRMTLTGSAKLLSRPMTVYEDLCRENGFEYNKGETSLTVSGRLKSGSYTIDGSVSSQFVSGLLFVLPLLEGDSVIKLIPPVESRSYISMTLKAMRSFGVEADFADEYTIKINGGQRYSPSRVTVEGDFSNAAFFEALNYAGSDVAADGLAEDSLQGDRIYREYFPILALDKSAVLDISDCPDLGPVLFAVAALTGGGRFTGTRRLKIKESDRGAAMREELAAFGIEMECGENEITVLPGDLRMPDRILSGHNDHRIVMALSVLLSKTGGEIDGAQAVNKSFPDFFNQLKSLGAEVMTDAMDQ